MSIVAQADRAALVGLPISLNRAFDVALSLHGNKERTIAALSAVPTPSLLVGRKGKAPKYVGYARDRSSLNQQSDIVPTHVSCVPTFPGEKAHDRHLCVFSSYAVDVEAR